MAAKPVPIQKKTSNVIVHSGGQQATPTHVQTIEKIQPTPNPPATGNATPDPADVATAKMVAERELARKAAEEQRAALAAEEAAIAAQQKAAAEAAAKAAASGESVEPAIATAKMATDAEVEVALEHLAKLEAQANTYLGRPGWNPAIWVKQNVRPKRKLLIGGAVTSAYVQKVMELEVNPPADN